MTDMTLAEREQLEALIQHTINQTRTEAEKAEAQARLDAQIADTRVMLACESGAARVYLDGVDLGTLVPHPEATVFEMFRSLGPALRAKIMRKMAAQPLDASRPIELLDPVTGEFAALA